MLTPSILVLLVVAYNTYAYYKKHRVTPLTDTERNIFIERLKTLLKRGSNEAFNISVLQCADKDLPKPKVVKALQAFNDIVPANAKTTYRTEALIRRFITFILVR